MKDIKSLIEKYSKFTSELTEEKKEDVKIEEKEAEKMAIEIIDVFDANGEIIPIPAVLMTGKMVDAEGVETEVEGIEVFDAEGKKIGMLKLEMSEGESEEVPVEVPAEEMKEDDVKSEMSAIVSQMQSVFQLEIKKLQAEIAEMKNAKGESVIETETQFSSNKVEDFESELLSYRNSKRKK